ncbi:MAG: type II toxin-antitoxin system PemK/MazF family toxin [Bacteroidetes bacterium]|nr:type II toxin-antitoxin system PemK/MazF family toxin [Bacteroidota bacterium]MDA0943676.1 type II toxin-antitoxin system PemK/MazF family toxin [Bacteroidota bacterium]MDA1111543.1 type II toxin-antitoxin system PemK/MazF family toxin [Bacteroidota bacterium]
MMKQFDLFLADLNPRMGTEAGKVRPVLIVQTDLLNGLLESTLVCPISTQIIGEDNPLRYFLKKGIAGLEKDSEIMIDQVRAIDNRRLKTHLGTLDECHRASIKQKLADVFDLGV